MSSEKAAPIYAKPEEHLAQGDIFFCHALGIYGGTDLKILRGKDGSRPSATFASTADVAFVNAGEAFQHSVAQEIVFCRINHLSYFIIASQTCDVAGVDHDVTGTCVVLKITPFCDFVNHDNLPFPWREENGETVQKLIPLGEFLASNLDRQEAGTLEELREDRNRYPLALRKVLKSWKPKDKSNAFAFKNKLQNFLTGIVNNKGGRTYYLPENKEANVPESYVDFTDFFPVDVKDIANAKNSRIATLANPYKEDFSQRLGTRFSRVALPVPVRGEKF